MVRRAWKPASPGDSTARTVDRRCPQLRNQNRHRGRVKQPRACRLGLRWRRDRVAQTLPAVHAASTDVNTEFPGFVLMLARSLAADPTGQDEARELLTAFADDNFNQLRRGTFWSSAPLLTAETAHLLDLPDIGRVIREPPLALRGSVAFTGSWVTAPIAYGIGIAMTNCHDPRAHQLLEPATPTLPNTSTPPFSSPTPTNHPSPKR